MATEVVQGALNGATKLFNPFGLPAEAVMLWTNTVGPGVELVANSTLGRIYDNPYVNYIAVLLFSMSLFVITLSDQAPMTAPFRTLLMKLHFVFLKCVRCVTIIGLFFLGAGIGQSGSFIDGLRVGGPIVTAGGALFMVQRMLEGFTATVPGVKYYDKYEAGVSEGAVPWVKGLSWFQTLAQVFRDYLDNVVTTCTDSLVGIVRQSGGDLTQTSVDNLSKAAFDANDGPNAIRYLWQAQSIIFNYKGADLYSNSLNDGSIMALNESITATNFFFSPLLIGVLVGLLK